MFKLSKAYLFILITLFILLTTSSMASDWVGYDFGGETVRIQTRWAGVTPIAPQDELNWYQPDARLQAHIHNVEALFNVKIEFVDPGEWFRFNPQHLITQAIAGDVPFHFFDVAQDLIAPLVGAGVLHQLDTIIEDDFYASYPASFRYDKYNPGMVLGSHLYGFESKNYAREPVGIIWDMDLFEQENLPNLFELYQNGEWTWDALVEIAKQATKDTSGDGVIDQFGFMTGARSAFINSVDAFGGTFYREVDGRREFGLDDDKAIQGLEFMANLFREGIANGVSPHNWWDNRLNANWAMGLWFVHDVSWQLNPITGRSYGIVPAPIGPGSTEHSVDVWAQWFGAIPISVDNPRAVIEVVKALWQLSEPYIEDLDEWEENYWFNSPGHARYVSDRQSLENWQWLVVNAKQIIPADVALAMQAAGWDWNWNHFYESVVQRGQSIASYIEARRPIIQAELDDLLGQ